MDLYRVPLSALPACSAPMRCGAGSSTANGGIKRLSLDARMILLLEFVNISGY